MLTKMLMINFTTAIMTVRFLVYEMITTQMYL